MRLYTYLFCRCTFVAEHRTFLFSSLFYFSCGLGGRYNLQEHGDALRWETRISHCGLGVVGGRGWNWGYMSFTLDFKIMLLKITSLTITVTQLFVDCIGIHTYTECPRRNVPNFGRVFLMLNYTDITQNTYIQNWTVREIMAREVWNFDSCYTLTDYQIHIETGRNMWFL